MHKDKIKIQSELLKIVKRLKANKKSIGFTNGCFDIIHRGHIKYLEDAAKKCDILIVGLNSDKSVKNIKGSKRPINPQKDRLSVVAALSSVDYTVLFSQKTPLDLINKIKPDVLIKGADWQKKNIVGAKEVSAYGGKISRIRFLKGYSTSNIIRKIQSLK